MTLSGTINTTSNITTATYCNLTEFSKSYREVHGYLSILVCVFGSVTNIFNICVLTRREMRWPTNTILTGLAVADLLVMLDYIPFSIRVYFDPHLRQTADYFTYSWAVYMLFHALFTQICHFISCCLTVILAVWRYIAIKCPQNNLAWCNPYRTKVAIVFTYILCPIMCFPIYPSLSITPHYRKVYQNGTLVPLKVNNAVGYNRTIYVVSYQQKSIYTTLSFWVYGVVIKLVPCILLTILSKQLISALIAAKKRRYNLLYNKNAQSEGTNGDKSIVNQRLLKNEHQTERTTKMLLAVLLLFLITEFPQAILGLLSATIGDEFDVQCQRPLGEQKFIHFCNSNISFLNGHTVSPSTVNPLIRMLQ